MIKLVDVLANPEALINLPPSALSNIIAEARYYNMLAQLKYICESKGYWNALHNQFKQHLDSGYLFYVNQRKQLANEAEQIAQVLTPLKVNWVYLKGGAYHLSEMKCFSGRMMNDIDILVEERDLARVEEAFKINGWLSSEISNYDDKFYRSWSQEIPPLRHLYRQIELDVHFNILPKTLKESLDGRYLFEESTVLNANSYEKVMKPHAMLMHSAIHLFYESEYHKGLRDLYDIYILINAFGKESEFWRNLIDLQHKVGNERSVYCALRYSRKVFNVDIPSDILEYYNQYKPNTFYLRLLDFCFLNVFTSNYPPYRKFGYTLSELALYLRGHLKRMPLRLLVPHLAKKSFDKFKVKEEIHDLI
ncbi:nucleotidyltransferase family protein [Vibrio japonicus]|uniref:Nucleotidyltransferase family protein n=1 Tax=Vibrio japonicus TaxID=1824638 RepID=A0ABY5LN90_9VIBR|nr:nucleotidyltransferase family protein [Vibrio japonicus]UUM32242.1 nucleotidyltransferase family protein [Vibrio japonicus]